jgi:hypothetical protein
VDQAHRLRDTHDLVSSRCLGGHRMSGIQVHGVERWNE